MTFTDRLLLCAVDYGEPSFGGWPHVSSTFGSFDLSGFAKAGAWVRTVLLRNDLSFSVVRSMARIH